MIPAAHLARLTADDADPDEVSAVFAAMRAAWGLDLLAGEGRAPGPWRPLRAGPPRTWGTPAGPLAPVVGSAAALAAAFATGRATPSGVLEVLLARLAAADLGLAGASPFSDLDPRRARLDAREADERWRRGVPRGPLDGVPVPVKDHHALAGLPARAGTAYRTRPARRDGGVALALRAAGAVLPGTSTSTEWGLDAVGRAGGRPLPLNPHTGRHAPGGSSTGAGVAVSLGLVPLALGSDGGGSLRIPAALLGLFALKPSWRPEILAGDAFAPSTLCVNGGIATTCADLAALAGVGGLDRGIARCRLGLPVEAWASARPEVAAAGQALCAGLEASGAVLVPTQLSRLALAEAVGVAAVAEGMGRGLAAELLRPELEVGADTRLLARFFTSLPEARLAAARRARGELQRDVAAALGEVDLLAFPTTLGPAPSVRPGMRDFDPWEQRDLCHLTFLANACGLPAGSVPAGCARGLPVGLQFVGDHGDDAGVLAAMAACERAGLAVALHPPGWR